MRNSLFTRVLDLCRARLRQAATIAALWAMAGYFGYHVVHGRHGLETRGHIIERSQLIEFEAKSLNRVRARLARDVALLTPEIPDADLVEEIARDVLGYVHPDDRIVTRR